MVQTRSSTRNSLDSEENNTTQGNGPQHAKTEEEPGLSELTTGRRPIKRKYSDDDPDADEEKPQKRKRIPRGGQRKTHVFHIPVPDPQELKVIRRNFKRPQNRQVWGVIRDHFSALEDLWIKKYEWNMPTTRTELDYGLLVRNIYKYRHIPSSNGRTCDRCSARGQTGCLHNGVDRCKGCVRNGVQCTVTNKRSGQTRILQGNLNANEPVSDPGAMVTWCTPDQQPPLPKGPAKKHRSDAGIDDEVKERRVATAGPSTQVPQQDFVGHARGNPTMRNSQQLPVQQQNPTTFFENGSYTNNPFADPQLYPDDTSFETQQGLPFGGQYQMHPEYPMPPDSTGFNLHFPQYDQGSNGVGLQPQFSQLGHGRPFIHDREIMMNAIIELRAEVQRLGGNTSIAADLVALAPIQRAPATLQGPAPFPSRRQSQSANTATASHSNPVTPTSPLFESALEDVTPTSSAFDYNTQHQSPGSGFLDTKVHRQSPTSAGFEHNIHNQTDTSSLFNSAAHNPGPTSAPSHNNMSRQGPAQPLFSSEFELPPEFTGFPSNFQQFGQQPSETPIDPSLLEYPNFLQLNTENASNRSRLETYDANGEVIPALKQEGTARMSRLSAAAHPELSGNGDETEIEARDTSLRSTKERLRGHAEEVLLEEEQGSPHIPLEKGWPADGPVQFGNMNANDDNDVQPVLDDDLPNDSLIIEQFDGFIAMF